MTEIPAVIRKSDIARLGAFCNHRVEGGEQDGMRFVTFAGCIRNDGMYEGAMRYDKATGEEPIVYNTDLNTDGDDAATKWST